jgi:hypothetical protein
MMRVESNRARGALQQLRLSLLHGLTFRLYSLCYRIEAIKSKLEVTLAVLTPTLLYFIVRSLTAHHDLSLRLTNNSSTSPRMPP